MLVDFQAELQAGVFNAWHDGAINVMMVSPTGSGKTVILGDTIQKMDIPTCAIAHRKELIDQLALALNLQRIPHGIIAPKDVVSQIIAREVEEHGHSLYNPRALTRVAAVDTMLKRDATDRWFNQVQLAVIDEGHHVLRSNKWGRALSMLPNARGLFPTAHALRADGAGLGRDAKHADGLVDRLVVGPCGRQLINRGLLTDYRLICPPSHIDMAQVPVGSTGDFNQKKLAAAVHADGTLVGSVVDDYIRIAGGKLGITFAVDLESAASLAQAFRAKGITAEVISGDTPIPIRGALMRKFRARQIIQLISVDVLGEGVDVPAVEVVSMARPTASFQLYAQQFGRALRLLLGDYPRDQFNLLDDAGRLAVIAGSPKPRAIIIDHVGNCHRFFEEHKFVDSPQQYTLNRREKTTRERKGEKIPARICLSCTLPYEAIFTTCPYCGHEWEPTGRTKPEEVAGDLYEVDPAFIKATSSELLRIDSPPVYPNHISGEVIGAIRKQHRIRQDAQGTLRAAIALWAGWWKHKGVNDDEIYRRFFFAFGVDVLTAQTLGAADAATLESRIRGQLSQHNIVSLIA